MRRTKLCELCHENPATVPDRERLGRRIDRVCGRCHAARLGGDIAQILAAMAKERLEREEEK